MARNFDEAANFVFMQLIKQEPAYMTKATQAMPGETKQFWLWKEFLMR
jgi:hypothetical protein